MFRRNVLHPCSLCIIIDLNQIQSPCQWRQCVLPKRREKLIFRGVTGLTQTAMIRVVIIIIIIIVITTTITIISVNIIVLIVPHSPCISRPSSQKKNAADRLRLTVCCHTCLYEGRYSVSFYPNQNYSA